VELFLEDEGSVLFRNVGTYLDDTISRSRRQRQGAPNEEVSDCGDM
jgi:hypothetical protein